MTAGFNPNDNDPIKAACIVGGSSLLGPVVGPAIGLGLYHFIKNFTR